MITASAPGKLSLFGEHAVVYDNYPCIVTAVDLRYCASVVHSSTPGVTFVVGSGDVNRCRQTLTVDEVCAGSSVFHRSIEFVAGATRRIFNYADLRPSIRITTDGPHVQYGLGSSSAIVVATIASIGALLDLRLSSRTLFDLAYNTVLDIQGKASGYDVAAAIYGGTLYFESGGRAIDSLDVQHLPILIAFTGNKSSSRELIAHVAKQKDEYPDLLRTIFDLIGDITNQARDLLLRRNWLELGRMANLNHGLLESLTVSSESLSELVYAARAAGALGAKLSGAGRGDCMYAIVSDSSSAEVRHQMELACARINQSNPPWRSQIVDIATNVQGVWLHEQP